MSEDYISMQDDKVLMDLDKVKWLSPRKQSVDRIMKHTYSYDYDRPKLFAGLWFVVASFLFIDAVAIALLIKFVL